MEDGVVKEDKTTINSSTVIDGNIKAKEHLIINGTIKGNVAIENFNLFLGPGGRLEGEIHAHNVRIRGHMKGDIKATGKVEITKEARFSGKIESKSLMVEQGADFDASVEMSQEPSGNIQQNIASHEVPTTSLKTR
jgi:cytoskeletal protein CcmA (bactofilin family)